MNIKPKALLIDSGIGEEVSELLAKAIQAHVDTGRTASVTLKITVKMDKDSGASKARGRVISTLPQGDDDSVTKKMPSVSLLTVKNDHPGQQTIEDAQPPMPEDKPELTVEQVIGRLKLAVAGSGTSASAYARKHGLPYLALSKLLHSGLVGSDAEAYGSLYDHALTLAVGPVEGEQDQKSKAAG